MQWLPASGDPVIVVLERHGSVRAWHGTRLEALYSKLLFRSLFLPAVTGVLGNAIVLVHQECTCTQTPLRQNQTTTPNLSSWFPAPRSTQSSGRFALIGHTVPLSHALQTSAPSIQNSVTLVPLWVRARHHSEMVAGYTAHMGTRWLLLLLLLRLLQPLLQL